MVLVLISGGGGWKKERRKMEDEAMRRLCGVVVGGRRNGNGNKKSSTRLEVEEAPSAEDEEEEIAKRHRLTLFSIQLSSSIVFLVAVQVLLFGLGQQLAKVAASPAPAPAPSPASAAGGALAYDRLEPAPGQTTRAARQQQLEKLLEAAHGSPRLHQLARQLATRDFRLLYPNEGPRERRDSMDSSTSASSKTPLGHYNRTNLVIKAFNYRFRLDLELNSNLFKDNLIQKHILPNGALLSDSSKLQHCYYHARSRPEARPTAIGAFRTCQPGLSGIIHLDNESFVIHPFYETDLSKKHPHIIYRYQSASSLAEPSSGDADPSSQEEGGGRAGECGNSHLHEWALRRFLRSASFSQQPATSSSAHQKQEDAPTETLNVLSSSDAHNQRRHLESRHDWQPPLEETSARTRKERDYRLATEKYIELGLVLSQDMFDKRNTTSPLELLHDALQIVNCLDLYFRSANTRVALIYIETWPYADQIQIGPNSTETLMEFWKYSARKLWHVGYDAAHLLTGGHLEAKRFANAEIGISWPGSICTPQGVSVSQEPASLFEPFVAASTIAHMLGHNLNMDHDTALTGNQQQQLVFEDQLLTSGSSSSSGIPAASVVAAAVKPVAGLASTEGAADEADEEVRGRSVSSSIVEPASDHQSTPADCNGSCLMSAHFNQIKVPVEMGSVWQLQQQQQVSSSVQVEPEEQVATPPVHPELDERQLPKSKPNPPLASLPFKFSKQSLTAYHKLINTNQAICLFNQPGKPETFQNCGNGIVEQGEDCDCGGSAECLESPDDCCDRITCRFKPDVQCISGSCCERCRLKAAGSVCRRARSDCDLTEVCDGKSSQCGPDLHKLNGHPCHNDTGYCYLGLCPSHESQCRDLWGEGASEANRLCFAQLNANGTHRGNCGTVEAAPHHHHHHLHHQPATNSNNKRHYKRCEPANIMCGTLQCQLGDMRPVIGAPLSALVAHSVKSLKTSEGGAIECKALEPEASLTSGSSNGNKLRQLAYVRDGTKCAPGSVCFNQSCQLITAVYRQASELCPRDEAGLVCSGNGLCSSAFRCHCDPDWAGHDCSQRVPVSTSLVPMPRKDATAATSMKMLVEFPDSKSAPKSLQNPTATLQPPIHLLQPQPQSLPVPGMQPPPAPPSPPPPPQPSTGTQSTNSVTMEKTSEAIGAPTLVFILVSIVAAVYVGFALMANCYRRKGFLKPDKVLRHHQMNCKLDAIRSSFIAKRLADAANGFGIGPEGLGALSGGAGNGCGGALGDEPIGVAYAPFSSAGPTGFPGSQLAADLNEPPFIRAGYPTDSASPQHLARGGPTNLATANVHYFEQAPGVQLEPGLKGQHQSYRLQDNLDDIPLLQGLAHRNQHHHHLSTLSPPPAPPPPPLPPLLMPKQVGRCDGAPKQVMRSFGRPQVSARVSSGAQQAAQCDWSQRTSTYRAAQQSKCPINRTTSLGNVNNRQQQQQQHRNGAGSRPELVDFIFDGDYESEDEPTTRLNQRALTTPCRRYSGNRGLARENCRHTVVDDSCSAPSSPERRHPIKHNWAQTGVDHNSINRRNRQRQSGHTNSSWHQPPTSTVYQPDVFQSNAKSELSASRRSLGGTVKYVNRQTGASDYGSEPDLLLASGEGLPPPPPPLEDEDQEMMNRTIRRTLMMEDTGENSSDLAIAEDLVGNSFELDSDEGYTQSLQTKTTRRKRRSVPSTDRTGTQMPTSPWRTCHQVRRVPINSGGQQQQQHQTVMAQLQQLEQAQRSTGSGSNQLRGSAKALEGGLDEFLALPLSVQLSALLSRSLNQQPPSASSQQPDDILNNLDCFLRKGGQSTQVASSRRSQAQNQQTPKKYAGDQVNSTDSMKRQQIKLHNLQSLINRLQRLHSQTVLECQVDELGQAGSGLKQEDESEPMGSGSRHSTLAKLNHRSTDKVLRRTTTTESVPPDEVLPYPATSAPQTGSLKLQNRPRSKNGQPPRNLQFDEQTSFAPNNDSVYSMSDSEEGTFVSRLLISTYQQVDVQTSNVDNKRDANDEKHNHSSSDTNHQQTKLQSQPSFTTNEEQPQQQQTKETCENSTLELQNIDSSESSVNTQPVNNSTPMK